MKKMILIFSHKLSDEQKKEAKENWNINEFVSLPEELQNIWSNIDPDLDTLNESLVSIK